jgi:tRNA pseudouridine38-40 synthase
MEIAYDGGRFRGVAANAGVSTVVGSIRPVLERSVGHDLEISVAGRTDAGVHARAQVISFDVVERRADPQELCRAINRNLVPGIVAQSCSIAPDDFDARFSATHRHYRYTVLNRPVPDPFLAATTWWMGTELDLNAMILACDPIIGSHDFSSFCRRPKTDGEVSLIRRVQLAQWHDLGDGVLRFDIRANAFCQQMVRSLVGTMVDMGRGHLRAGEMTAILAAGDRSRAGQVAPPQGLCLWEVGY